MPWPDEAARNVLDNITLLLESSIRIDRELSLLVEFLFSGKHINDHQKETIYNGSHNLARIGKLLDFLIARGTTDCFVAFANIIGSDEGENLPHLREHLIKEYGYAGGDLTVFGASGSAIPRLSCSETEIPIQSLNSRQMVVKNCPGVIRDVTVTSFTDKAIFLLFDFGFSRILWSTRYEEPTQIKYPQYMCSETPERLLVLKPNAVVLIWPRKFHTADFNVNGYAPIVADVSRTPVECDADITSQAAFDDDIFILGDEAGCLTLCRMHDHKPRPKMELSSAVSGMEVGEKDKFVTWTAEGQINVWQIRNRQFDNPKRLTMNNMKIRTCTGDFSKQFAICQEDSNGEILLSIFEEERKKLSHKMGPSRDNCVQVIVNPTECIATTSERVVFVHENVVSGQFHLPWKGEDIENLRIHQLGRRHYFLVATKNTKCYLLEVKAPSPR